MIQQGFVFALYFHIPLSKFPCAIISFGSGQALFGRNTMQKEDLKRLSLPEKEELSFQAHLL